MFPREQGRAECFRIFENENVPRDFGLVEDDYSERALAELQRRGIEFVYGDCVRIGNGTYRNTGIMIYNGTKFIHLRYDDGILDYGCPPKEFTVIKHSRTNEIVPIDYYPTGYATIINIVPELFQDLEFAEDKKFHPDPDDVYYKTELKYQDKTITILASVDSYDVQFLNKFIHSGMTITLDIHYDGNQDIGFFTISDEEREKVLTMTTVKSVE